LFLSVMIATAVMGRFERRSFGAYGLPLREGFLRRFLYGAIWGVVWALVFILTGIFEEFAVRGYPQFTLTRSVGFWPAAIITSLILGVAHAGNSGEAMQVWSGCSRLDSWLV
jgi:membrane protease YdiL (CAAX protease family)